MTTELIYAIGAAVAILIIVIWWKRIVRAVILLAGLGLAGAVVYAFAQQATATRQVATAATVAARGSAAGNVAIALLLALIFMGVVVCGYVVLRRWYLARTGQVSPWNEYAPQFQQHHYPSVPDTSSINTLVQLEVLRTLRELRAAQSTTMLAVRDDDDGADYGAWWGNA